jgi:tetratricopeptide (TPR) repeat protein
MGATASLCAASPLDFSAVDDAAVEAGSDGGMRRALQLGITLAGVRKFAAQHWRGELCEPECARGARFPASGAERAQLIEVLCGAGRTNTWAGDCPVLRVLEADGWRDAASGDGGELPLLADVVRREMNGYANQAAIMHACPEGRSWCEVLEARGDKAVGKATVFVSWALGQRVEALADALQRWLADHPERDPAQTFFWVCDFCIRQTGGDTKADVGRLGDMVRTIGTTVLFLDPWDAPAPLLRAWCLWEIYHTVDGGAALDVVMSTEQQARFATALVKDFESITMALSKIDVHKAETRKETDKALIMGAVAASVGAQRLNEIVLEQMRGWVADAGRGALAALPPAERATSKLINQVAMLLKEQGRLDEARPLLEEAVAGCRAALSEAHPSTLTAVNNLGNLLKAQGRLNDAQPLLEEALAGYRTALGEAHPDTLTAVNNLASLLRAQNRLDEARPLFEEALAGNRAALGEAHPRTLTSIGNLGMLLQAQGRLDEARPLLEEALAGKRAVLGETHPETLNSVNSLGALLKAQGRLDEARPLLEEALAGRRAALGEAHPSTLTSIANLAVLLRDAGQLDEARVLLEEALAGKKTTLGEAHPGTLTSMLSLGLLLEKMGKRDEALTILCEALAGLTATVGDEHPLTRRAAKEIERLHE